MAEHPDNADLSKQIADQNAKIDAQSAKIDAMYAALMEPQPGQQHSLLDRMAAVTIAIEGGQFVGKALVWIAGVLVALGSIWVFTHPGAGQ